ncbi:MAG: class I SAM-dependent methyltransferase [Roseiflexaceae bacterium]
MKSETLTQLHAPLIPILRHALALAPLPCTGVALDLACGPGLKAALLAEALGPGVRLVGIDSDPAAIREQENGERAPAGSTENRRTENRELRTENGYPAGPTENRRTAEPQNQAPSPLHLVTRSPAHWDDRQSSVVGRRSSIAGVVGDALALPLRDGCCDAAFCIAALGLFADPRTALRELRRALRPGGPVLLAVATQAWAQVVRWPPDLAARLAAAYVQALANGAAPIPTTPDLGADLADVLAEAGFAAPLVRAFWLDRRPPTADCRLPTCHGPWTTDHPLASELPLLPWPALRGLLAQWLPAAELARCDALAAAPDVELCTLALVALAYAA